MRIPVLDDFAERGRDGVLLVARVLLCIIFVLSGYGKLGGLGGFAAMLAAKGFFLPWAWTIAAVATEFLGSLAVLVGVATRPLALLMAVFTLFAAFIGHPFWAADPAHYEMQYINFLKNLAIIGGFLALFVAGPGRASMDGLLKRR